jgi:hypothetical protein
VGYTWYDTTEKIKYVSVLTPSNTVFTTQEIINPYESIPSSSPEIINIVKYDPTKDETVFINLPEGTPRPITSIKNRVDSNTTVGYEEFVKDDGY